MNKKQLIVAWIVAILLSIIALSVDYHQYRKAFGERYFSFEELIKFGLPVLIIGGLLIYTLRDKKK